MDQPYSRIADALLDRQYWAPDDPQKHPYDDTVVVPGFICGADGAGDRCVDLKAKMEAVTDAGVAAGSVDGSGDVAAINNSGEITLLGLRYALKDAKVSVAEQAFDAGGKHFGAGSADRAECGRGCAEGRDQGCGCGGGEPGCCAVGGYA